MVETKVDGAPPTNVTKLRFEAGAWVTPTRKTINWTPTHWRTEA